MTKHLEFVSDMLLITLWEQVQFFFRIMFSVTTLSDIWFHIVYQHVSILDCYTMHQGCLHTQICLPSHSLICDIHIVSQKVFLVTDCIWVRPELYINICQWDFLSISTLGSIFTLFANVTSREQTYFFKNRIVNNYFWHIQVIWEWDWYLVRNIKVVFWPCIVTTQNAECSERAMPQLNCC